jgi:hypothetical protein
VTLSVATSSPTVTGVSIGAVDPATQSVTLALQGSLPAGGEAKIVAKGVVVGGPGTPGCVIAAPTSACPTAEPDGAPLTFGVTHVDQPGDPDSFGPDCRAGTPVTACATGIHDKQAEPDEVDPVGHNVDAAVGASSTYDLSASMVALAPADSGTVTPGSSVVVRASAFDTGPATGLTGWTLTVVLPKSTQPALPAGHALRSCVKSTSSAGYPTVTCTGKGPLSPGVTSFATDITVPASWPLGTAFTALVFVKPAAGQGAETIPLGVAPTTPTTDAGQTATDNDASLVLRAGP